MGMWRCPHCRTPQPESARCWVCHRSSTACGTCRHFRRSVAAQLGYCGLDKRRTALRGDEIRACWEAPQAAGTTSPTTNPAPPVQAFDRTDVRRLDFVPVSPPPAAPPKPERQRRPDPDSDPGLTAPIVEPPPEPRWNLWGDLDG